MLSHMTTKNFLVQSNKQMKAPWGFSEEHDPFPRESKKMQQHARDTNPLMWNNLGHEKTCRDALEAQHAGTIRDGRARNICPPMGRPSAQYEALPSPEKPQDCDPPFCSESLQAYRRGEVNEAESQRASRCHLRVTGKKKKKFEENAGN